jgi:serine/threonine protein kinase
MNSTDSTLPEGYRLNEYRVESILGTGGFGVTYLATDCNLNLKVALKEYLPVDYAARGPGHAISARTPADADAFDKGLRGFLDEARTLASFHHLNIVRVMRFFEGNHTGYMVMEFVEGQPLSSWITGRRPLPQPDALSIMGSLLDGLEVIHDAGYLHRDIKPANIYMRLDGTPVLIDFGSARSRHSDQHRTAMVSPGYAPFEQYHAHGKQGPWSDLYALGGVMYWMVTGTKPVEAAARIRDDILIPASAQEPAGRYSAEFLAAIDWALKPHENERPQNVTALRARLGLAGQNAAVLRAPPKPAVVTLRSCAMAALRGGPPSDEFDWRTLDHPAATTATDDINQTRVASGFDADLLMRIETEAARVLGPIAPVIVRKAARKTTTLPELCQSVAQEIEDEKSRKAFLRKFANHGHTAPPTHPSTQPNSGTPSRAWSCGRKGAR